MKKNNIIDWGFPLFVSACCVAALISMSITGNNTGVMAVTVCLFICWLPFIFSTLTPVKIPSVLQFLGVLQMFLGVFIGSGLGIYYKVPFWDTILHTWAGTLFCIIGLWLIVLSKDNHKMRTINIVMYALGFSFMVAVFWEIWEFGADCIISGSNMQKFALEDGTLLVGHEALKDTMDDMICHSIGSVLFIIIYFIDFRAYNGRLFKSIDKDFTIENEKEIV